MIIAWIGWLGEKTKVVHTVHASMPEHDRPPLKPETMTELRKYKAEHGLTYDEAVRQLLDDVGWLDD